jgi:histidine phosphotransferase ChpT
VKLLLNLLVIAQQTIPRGGVLTVDPLGEGEAMGFQITAAGLNARLSQTTADLLAPGSAGSIDAHAVQPYYTRLLAEACGISIALVADSEKVVVTAR